MLSHVQSFIQQSHRETKERRPVSLDVLVGFAEKNLSPYFIYIKPCTEVLNNRQVVRPHFTGWTLRVDSKQCPHFKGRLRARANTFPKPQN